MKKDVELTSKEKDLFSSIYNKLNNGSLEQLVELLHLLINKTEIGTSVEVLKKPIMLFLYENSDLDMEPFTYINKPNNLALFVSHFVYLILYTQSENTEDQIKYYNMLLNYLSGYQKVNDKPLSNKTIEKLLSLYNDFDKDKKIGFNSDERPLLFLTVGLNHTNHPYYYHPISNILLLNTISKKTQKEKNLCPEYVFFFSVSHVLQMKITESQTEVPESFKAKIIDNLFLETPKNKLTLMFADCFTIALMNNTEFESKNPYIKNITTNKIEKIENYFEWLIEEI